MTDQTQPEIPGAEDAVTPPPSKTAWFLDDGKPVKADVEGREDEKSFATKKAAAEYAANLTVPAPAPRDAAYLPTLPEGYSYTKVEIDGPDGTRLTVGPGSEGPFTVDVQADDIARSTPYLSFAAALRGAADRAKLLVKRAARKAELEALDAEFGE